MEIIFFAKVIGFLAIVFTVLGLWQRSIEKESRRKILSEFKTAKLNGTSRAIAQFPQIQPWLCIGCGSCIAACPENEVLGLIDGVAHVIHGSRCIGHGLCAKACPVGAITVGLGDVSARPDLPILSESMESSVSGLYIAGELGGIALIRNAIEQGKRCVEHIAERIKRAPAQDGILDLLIVGAGPAGISASLKAIELGLRHKVIDEQPEIGGTVRKYPRRKLTLVQSAEIPLYGTLKSREYLKEDLVALWHELVERFKIPVQMQTKFSGLVKHPDHFEVQTQQGALAARFVLLALGRRGSPRKLGVPGEESERVLYQVLDASSYTGQKILVVGGGDSAVEAAMAFANQRGNSVTISYRKPNFFRLKARNEQRIADYIRWNKVHALFSSQVEMIEAGRVLLKDEKSRSIPLENDYVFVLAGSEPPFELLKAAGIRFGGEPLQTQGHAIASNAG